MTNYVAFPTSTALAVSSLTLIDNFEKGLRDSQSKLFVDVAQHFTDEIITAFVLNIVSSADPKDHSSKIMTNFASVIKSTVNGLIKQVLGKMSNDELRPLARYIKAHRLTFMREGKERIYIAFAISEDFYQQFSAVLERGIQGETINKELTSLMENFAVQAHEAFYDESLKSIKLGFIGRKLVDVGSIAIRKGSQTAVRHLMPTLQGDNSKRFCAYFHQMLIKAE